MCDAGGLGPISVRISVFNRKLLEPIVGQLESMTRLFLIPALSSYVFSTSVAIDE